MCVCVGARVWARVCVRTCLCQRGGTRVCECTLVRERKRVCTFGLK